LGIAACVEQFKKKTETETKMKAKWRKRSESESESEKSFNAEKPLKLDYSHCTVKM